VPRRFSDPNDPEFGALSDRALIEPLIKSRARTHATLAEREIALFQGVSAINLRPALRPRISK